MHGTHRTPILGIYPVSMHRHALWHPFADMSVVAGNDFIIASGDGCTVTDTHGRTYLDSTAGLWFANIGHGRIEVAQAAAQQMSRLAAYSTFGDYANAPVLELADRIAAMVPMTDAKVFFTSGGSDSVDTAVKMVRKYWQLLGKADKQSIVTRTSAYHGMHVAGTSLGGIAANRAGFEDFGSQGRTVAWDDPQDLEAYLHQVGPEHVAAFFCEPIIGAGGVYLPPDGYLERVRQICRDHDVLFVADEVISGFGRTGFAFASTRWQLDPDIILAAKGMTSGYAPMGAVVASGTVADPFWAPGAGMWRHGYTYSGHAVSAAVALANLDILERESLVTAVRGLEVTLSAALAPLRGHQFVHQVRSGIGLLGAVQLDPAVLADDPGLPTKIVHGLRHHGVVSRMLADGSIQISPPFTITRRQLQELSTGIDAVLTDLGSAREPIQSLHAELLPEQDRDYRGFDSLDDQLLLDVPPHHGS